MVPIPLVNGVRYAGQDPKKGITYSLAGATLPEVGEIVGPSTTAPGTVIRPADGGLIEGQLVSKERDNKGSVQRGEVMTATRTGAINLGWTQIAGDGDGGVKAASGTLCRIINTFSVGGDDFVTFYIP